MRSKKRRPTFERQVLESKPSRMEEESKKEVYPNLKFSN